MSFPLGLTLKCCWKAPEALQLPTLGDAIWKRLWVCLGRQFPLSKLWRICGSYCTFIALPFVLFYYYCILLSLLTPLLSTCAPKEMDEAHPLQYQEVVFSHNQFSANLIHLIFHILTRLSEIILLSKGGSSTARINPLQLPKEIIVLWHL